MYGKYLKRLDEPDIDTQKKKEKNKRQNQDVEKIKIDILKMKEWTKRNCSKKEREKKGR